MEQQSQQPEQPSANPSSESLKPEEERPATSGFRVIDRRGREDEPDPEPTPEEQVKSVINQIAHGIGKTIGDTEKAPPLAHAQGVMGPILVIGCPHCDSINKTIEEHTLMAFAQGKRFVSRCLNPECAKPFTVKRSTLEMPNQGPNRHQRRTMAKQR